MSNMLQAVGARSMSRMIIAAAVCASGASAHAAISGQSDAHALSADVHLVATLVGINVGPLPVASGAAPGVYDVMQTAVAASASFPAVAGLSTGVLNAHASSDIGFASISGQTFAESTVDGLSLVVVPGVILTPDLINLSATTIGSSAQVAFDGSNLTTNGGFTIEDLVLSVSGANIPVNANAAPNTVLLDAAGIRIVLNEQILTTMGDTTSLEVNALHITINSPLQIVGANVVIGHSFASMTVPAPGAAGVLGASGLLAVRRRRRSTFRV